MDRVGNAERAVAVATGSLVGDAISVAADCTVGRTETCTIDRDEVVDLALQLGREQVSDTPQIARAFLADVADEVNRAGVLDVGALECARNREHDGQAAAVIANARAGEPGAF